MLLSCSLLVFTAYFTYVKAGSHNAAWNHHYFHHVDKLETAVETEKTRLGKEITKEQNATLQTSEAVIMAFYQKETEHSKKDIVDYQRTYLSRLMKAEDSLKENTLRTFTEVKKAEINTEISEDVEAYLADLLED